MKSVKYLLALYLMVAPLCGEGISENFDQVPANTSLSAKTIAGWQQEGPAIEGSAVICNDAGFPSGNGLRIEKRETFVVCENGSPFWTHTDGAFTFKIDFRIAGKMPFDITLHNGSTSAGFYISINSRTGEISVSQGGGESAFKGAMSKYSAKELKKDTWYTLEVRDVTLRKNATEPVVGKLYLYEAANSADLILDGVSIIASGGSPLASIKTMQIRRWGEGVLDVDNVTLSSASAK